MLEVVGSDKLLLICVAENSVELARKLLVGKRSEENSQD